MKTPILLLSTLFLVAAATGCDQATGQSAQPEPAEAIPSPEFEPQAYIEHGETYNPEAVIPPQCYTQTEGENNPCYVCHQSYLDDKNRPNMMNDGFLQGSYAFSDIGNTNRWQNLFKDRSEEIQSISDEFILDYIRDDNYTALVEWFASDAWTGRSPSIEGLADGADAFDDWGLARDGSGWVAFNYKPLPSTFWPTNGSTDDVMIRLPGKFGEIDGHFSRDLYYANLALVEMAIIDKARATTPPLDERAAGIDFNADGQLDSEVTKLPRRSHYLGDAQDVQLAHMLYPQGTEFLHTVRYVGIENGEIVNARRMKEVRYMRKATFMNKPRLANAYYNEAKEKHFGNLPQVVNHGDRGMSNGMGWLLWGFIEDADGTLRKQNDQEQFFCMGCHKTVGTTIDQTFSFARKKPGASGWGYIDLKSQTDAPNIGETRGEYLTYMQRVGGGDEFRQNGEMLERWFDKNGQVDAEKVEAQASVYELITPSTERALALNKAYYRIVQEQSYLFGRDAVLSPASNVFETIDTDIPPLEAEHRFEWDIRLDWE